MARILLIDDDKIFSKITKKSCQDAGIEIDTVESLKALKQRNLESYDGLLVDYDLKDGTGEQVIEFLHDRKVQKPVALISSTNRDVSGFAKGDHMPVLFISKWQSTDAFLDELKNFVPGALPA